MTRKRYLSRKNIGGEMVKPGEGGCSRGCPVSCPRLAPTKATRTQPLRKHRVHIVTRGVDFLSSLSFKAENMV
jgi:hypothetical protein